MTRRSHSRFLGALLLALGAARLSWAATLEPLVYTIRVPAPETHLAEVEATVPTSGRPTVEMMMPIWTPGYYRVEDYAAQVRTLSARAPDGTPLGVDKTSKNRWRVQTNGSPTVLVSYRLLCEGRSVTTNWISPSLGILNGGAAFITLTERARRPHEVRLALPPSLKSVMTALAPAPDGEPNHYRAADFDELVDSPIVFGHLSVHAFEAGGKKHYLVDAGELPERWDGEKAAADLAKIVQATKRFWGFLPYSRYLFLNVFRDGRGGLEHQSSTLLTADPGMESSPAAYHRWLSFVAHEYFHTFNVKRLRPVELGPFDYEVGPRTPSLWFSEGVTTTYAQLLLARAGLSTAEDLLAALSRHIDALQNAPGRLRQTLEQSSLEVWTNSTSGVHPSKATVSYYTKGVIVGFLLDARIRHVTGGTRSLDDVMRLAYERYSSDRGFTPRELRATAEEVAGSDLDGFFDRAIASTEELDYSEFLEWYGLRFATADPEEPDHAWKLEVTEDATRAQKDRLAALMTGRPR